MPPAKDSKFWISTLGCKVNHYESEQLATLLRARGWKATQIPEEADLRILNTCSVTIQAASKSRQSVRQAVRLPILQEQSPGEPILPEELSGTPTKAHPRILVTGCWATSDREEALKLPGVSAVLTHHDDVAGQLDQLLTLWSQQGAQQDEPPIRQPASDESSKTNTQESVKQKSQNQATLLSFAQMQPNSDGLGARAVGATGLPLLHEHQDAHQRGFLKVQDGCDAHCTYCIIPQLRPRLWSKSIDDTVEEAQRLVACGHAEIVLTGIFLGAYGQPTALRRRQPDMKPAPIAALVEALCTRVQGLHRLRLSSLEPGDLTPGLLTVFTAFRQVVPHFHLPLQSGSDTLLRRMNRQYGREDYLRMIEQVQQAFDRPAITTDIIVGFPGESATEFEQTLAVVERARFIHIHAFPFSPRPGTAAARWKKEFVRGPVVNERMEQLRQRAGDYSLTFRKQFVGQTVELMVERDAGGELDAAGCSVRHGRSERYFPVHFETSEALAGSLVRVRIDRVSPQRTHGTLLGTVEGRP